MQNYFVSTSLFICVFYRYTDDNATFLEDACALDPRFKSLSVLTDDKKERVYERVIANAFMEWSRCENEKRQKSSDGDVNDIEVNDIEVNDIEVNDIEVRPLESGGEVATAA